MEKKPNQMRNGRSGSNCNVSQYLKTRPTMGVSPSTTLDHLLKLETYQLELREMDTVVIHVFLVLHFEASLILKVITSISGRLGQVYNSQQI